MKHHLFALLLIGLAASAFSQTTVTPPTSDPTDPRVKKSTNNVCYEKSNINYKKIIKFTPYDSMEECRSSGGRPPKSIPKQP